MADEGLDNEKHVAAAYADPLSPGAIISRAKLLTGATVGLGGLLGAAIGVPAVGFLLGPSFSGEDWYWSNIGPASNFPVAGDANDPTTWQYTPVVFNRQPGSKALERRVAFVGRLKDEVAGPDDLIAISNTCMHLGCPVVSNAVGFQCPCHGGAYDKEGRRNAGPPVRPLNRFETKVEGGNVYVGRVFASKEQGGRVVMSDVWKDPGQNVQGLLSFLYPAPPR